MPTSSLGLGFNILQLTDEALAAAISCRPAVVWLAFPDTGRDFAAFVPIFKEAGCKVLCMVQTLDQAEEVVRVCTACSVQCVLNVATPCRTVLVLQSSCNFRDTAANASQASPPLTPIL